MSTYVINNSKKSVNLSPLEHKIYFSLYEKEIFKTGDAYRIISNKKTARQTVFRLKNKGFIKRIRKGVFAIVPAQMVGKDFYADRIVIASMLTEPYFLSHHSALEIHGVAQSYFNTTYISTSKALKSFEFQGIAYKFVTTKYLFGTEDVVRGNLKISTSDKERTILDCIRTPDYAGGIEELVRSISAFAAIDYKKLLKYMALFNEKSLFSRTGYLFDCLKDELGVPDAFLGEIRKNLGARAYYMIPGRKGAYVKEWNIIVPKNIKEAMRVA